MRLSDVARVVVGGVSPPSVAPLLGGSAHPPRKKVKLSISLLSRLLTQLSLSAPLKCEEEKGGEKREGR